jgi:micrococcal nuclease
MKILWTAAISAALLLAFAASASAQRDMDCSDFRTQREAQAFFKSQEPGDPHRLDGDNDGIACEALP